MLAVGLAQVTNTCYTRHVQYGYDGLHPLEVGKADMERASFVPPRHSSLRIRLICCLRSTVALFITGLAARSVDAQPAFLFVDVAAERGFAVPNMATGMGRGLAAADFDNDGDIDVFVPNDDQFPDQLYRNLGDGQFEEIAVAAGLGWMGRSRCALWFDYDADGDLDLVVANDVEEAPTTLRLYRQYAEARFEDVTQEAGLFVSLPPPGPLPELHRGGMCAGDINNDGYLDLFAPLWNGASYLFLNNQDGSFTDISASSGVGSTTPSAHQGMMADFNRDGWLDLYVAIDFAPNFLWINQGDGTFVESAASAGVDNAMNDMGMALGDFDNDGDLDIYLTNISFAVSNEWHNVLLRNDSIGDQLSFVEVSVPLGVAFDGWDWGVTFMDADNDGWLDIAATNGWIGLADMSKFFWNVAGTDFIDASDSVAFNDTDWGSALISFDYDRDGDLDLFQACMGRPLRLLDNRPVGVPNVGNYLVIKPRLRGPNRRAIGSVVRIRVGDRDMMRLITAGTSYLGQEPAEAFFGVGPAATIDSVTVEWPDGTTTSLSDIEANQVLTITGAGIGIPAVSHWGMVVLGLLVVTGEFIFIERRLQARRSASRGSPSPALTSSPTRGRGVD